MTLDPVTLPLKVDGRVVYLASALHCVPIQKQGHSHHASIHVPAPQPPGHEFSTHVLPADRYGMLVCGMFTR